MSGLNRLAFYYELAGTSPVVAFIAPIGAKARIVKLQAYNPDASNHVINVQVLDVTTGTPSVVGSLLPSIPIASGAWISLTEDQIPGVHVSSSSQRIEAIGLSLSATAGTPVQVAVEVEYS